MRHSEWQRRIQDMLDAIAEIQSFTVGMDPETFRQDRKTAQAVAYNFVILGEAARQIPSDVQARYSHVPWAQIRSMRNVVAHEYRRVDVDIVWQTVQGNLPSLVPVLREVLERES
ncbi:MAG: HepT-like ribonuclease domain-containing protein [Chloroflexota bacterium]